MRVLLLAALCAAVGCNTYADERNGTYRFKNDDLRGDKELNAKEIEAKLKAVKITAKWENKELSDIVKDLAAKTGVKITLTGKSTPMTLALADQDGLQALQMIKMLAGANVTFKNGEVLID